MTHSERRLFILGATGSVGRSTLDVVRHLRATGGPRFRVAGLAAGRNADALAALADEFSADEPSLAIAGDGVRAGDAPTSANAPARSPRLQSPRVLAGPDAALRLIEEFARPGDLVMAAMVGFAGLAPTLAAIERGCDVGLANKETLVAAGSLVVDAVRRRAVKILPVDSEHSAILQCLHGASARGVRRIVLTASGGPFRTWSRERMAEAPVEEALRHPTWSMGAKITIDSATMMNKALEVIEAHWLFDLRADQIDVIVHPQSIAHGFVEFDDGSVIAQLSPPDMKLPIQCALLWPDRLDGSTTRLDFTALRALHFEPVDHDRFPSVALGARVIESGGTAGAILNAANEEAVAAYLDRTIPFGRITALVAEALDSIPAEPIRDLVGVERADAAARRFVHERTRSQPAAATQDTTAWTP